MSEPGRDELAEQYSQKYHGSRNLMTATFAFKAGWDAALERLGSPDIIEAAADAISPGAPHSSNQSIASAVLTEVARLLGKETS